MATYDKETQDFIDSVAGKTKHPADKEKLIRQGVGIVRDISRGRPLSEIVARKSIGGLTRHEMAKEAAPTLSVINLYSKLNDKYGEDWHDWEPETLWQTISLDQLFGISDELKNMIQALQVVCKTNFPFEEWNVFENIGHAFNGNMVDFSTVQPLELNEIAWTCRALESIRPGTLYEDEVDGYIAACMKNAGVVYIHSGISKDYETINKAINRIGNDERLQLTCMVHINQFGLKTDVHHISEDVFVQLSKLQECVEYADSQAGL